MKAHLVLLLALLVLSAAASTGQAQSMTTPSPSSRVAIPSNALLTINGNIFEASAGQTARQSSRTIRSSTSR